MKTTKIHLLYLVLTLCGLTMAATNGVAQTKTYRGAWFSVNYPADFTAEGSLPSATTGDDGTYDSAIFTSPDGSVTFYVYSPQWSGDPTDIALQPGEKESTRSVTHGRHGQTVTFWTIGAKNGSYSRSYQETREGDAMYIIGIRYTTQKAYNKYKKQYLAFKASLEQFAD